MEAADLIKHTLSKMTENHSDHEIEGIAFVVGDKNSLERELDEFILRCLSDIKQSPESMRAGLSHLLLS